MPSDLFEKHTEVAAAEEGTPMRFCDQDIRGIGDVVEIMRQEIVPDTLEDIDLEVAKPAIENTSMWATAA